MKARDVASLGFALSGIYVLVKALDMLPALLTLPSYSWDDTYVKRPDLLIVGLVVPLAITIALGLTLIAKRHAFAAAVLGRPGDELTPIDARELHVILCSIVGVFLVGLALRDLPRVAHELALLAHGAGLPGASDRFEDYLHGSWVWLMGVLLQLAFGVILIAWSRRLVSRLRDRTAETRVDEKRCPHCDQPYSPGDYRSSVDKTYCSRCKNELPGPP